MMIDNTRCWKLHASPDRDLIRNATRPIGQLFGELRKLRACCWSSLWNHSIQIENLDLKQNGNKVRYALNCLFGLDTDSELYSTWSVMGAWEEVQST